VLDDEQQFVVVLGPADRPLRREQRGQVEVAAVAHAVAEVGDDGCLDAPRVADDGLLGVVAGFGLFGGLGHDFSLAARPRKPNGRRTGMPCRRGLQPAGHLPLSSPERAAIPRRQMVRRMLSVS
jgi:hypothetical protein